jgi:hypothetical protein
MLRPKARESRGYALGVGEAATTIRHDGEAATTQTASQATTTELLTKQAR